MIRTRVLSVAALLSLPLLVGCMPKMTVAEMKAMMPGRPAELDALNAWVGEWEWEGSADFAMLEAPLKSKGLMKTRWEGDDRYLVTDGKWSMEGLGEMIGHETWTYDSKSKRYRSTWVDSMGSSGTGEARLDADTNTWHFKASAYTPFGKNSAMGTAVFLDNDTIELMWCEMMGMTKTTEMRAVAKRVSR